MEQQIDLLKQKLLELKNCRDIMQGEASTGAAELTQLSDHANKLQAMLDEQKRAADEKQGKIKRIDAIIRESEGAYKKLTDNAKKLGGVIERELSSVSSNSRTYQY